MTSLYDRPGAAADASVFADCVEAIAASGDKAAFACLFSHFAPRLKAYLLRLGLESGPAEDCRPGGDGHGLAQGLNL